MGKEIRINILESKVKKCTKCHELVKSRTQTVFGEGNLNTNVLFLGEAPGKEEDETGRPFVGASGRLLNNILKECGISREKVYICNILKCRPEYNRTPRTYEADNCRGFLEWQIKIVNPKVIVCLGTVAAQNLLKVTTPVSKLRKSWYSYNMKGGSSAAVRVTYHPSYLLRNPSAKSDTWDDMLEVLKFLKENKKQNA